MVFFIFVFMDSFTQIVLGAAVSNAVLGKKIGNKSILYGAIFATLPDLDVWLAKLFFNPVTQIEIHRGLSHSLFFYFLISFLLAKLIQYFESKTGINFKRAYLASFLILTTHSLLDIFTTWGTQFLWPFFGKFALKSIFVIDPLYTIPLLICLLISIKKEKKDQRRYFWNNLGLAISSLYLLFSLALQFIVKEKVSEQLVKNGMKYHSIVVKPTAMNTILWNIIVEKNQEYLLSDYSFFDSKELKFISHPKNHDLISKIENQAIIKQLKRISEDQYIITSNSDGLIFNDLRFGLLKNTNSEKQYAFSYLLYQENGIWKAKEQPKEKRDGIALLKNLYIRLQGN